MRLILYRALPFSLCEEPLLRDLAPALPGRTEFSEQVKEIATKTREALRVNLANCTHLSIQYDGWMSRDRARYIGVMCQGLQDDHFVEYNLGTIPVTAQVESADVVAELVGNLIEQYAIEPTSCSTDSAAVESAALRLMNELRERRGHAPITWFPCFCHFINLILKEFASKGKKQFVELTELERSLNDSCAFSAFLRSIDSPQLKISKPTEVRWSSKIEMCYSIVNLKNFILAFRETKETEDAIATAEELIPILGIFEAILKRFESNEPGLIGEVQRSIAYLRVSLGGISRKEGQWANGRWENAANAALKKLDFLIKKHHDHMYPLCLVAARLNPWLDHETTLSEEEIRTADAHILASVPNPRAAHFLEEESDAQIAPDSPAAFSIPSYASFGTPGRSRGTSAPQLGSEQFREYDAVATFDRNQGRKQEGTLLDYWLAKKTQWPELAEFALQIVTRPVTSIATERHFSDTGRIVTTRRTRLLPDNVQDAALILTNREISENFVT
jgi:hypothetical protein